MTTRHAAFVAVLLTLQAGAGATVLAQTSLGDRAYLTRAELDSIRFGAPFASPDGAEPARKHLVDEEKFKTAVFMPKSMFQYGEALPACFILRSPDDNQDGNLPQLALFRGHNNCNVFVGDAVMDVHLRKSGKLYPLFDEEKVVGRHEKRLTTSLRKEGEQQRNGYYIAYANLNRLRVNDLPPGDYELYWRYGGLYSSSAKFTIKDPPPDTAKQFKRLGGHRSGTIFVAEITEAFVGREDKLKQAEPKAAEPKLGELKFPEHFSSQELGKPKYPHRLWKDTNISSLVEADDVVARLGRGIGDKFYPDPRRLPVEDDLLKLSVEWKREDGRDHLILTLEPRDRDRKVVLPHRLHVMLLAEYEDSPQSKKAYADSKGGDPKDASSVNEDIAPKIWEICLPKDWQKGVPVAAKVRLSVLISSDELSRQSSLPKAKGLEPNTVEWRGVLCSCWAELQLKPSGPSLQELEKRIVDLEKANAELKTEIEKLKKK